MPEIYLSDLHDENVIKSVNGNVFVIDCDIRINTPELKLGGIRQLTTEVEFITEKIVPFRAKNNRPSPSGATEHSEKGEKVIYETSKRQIN